MVWLPNADITSEHYSSAKNALLARNCTNLSQNIPLHTREVVFGTWITFYRSYKNLNNPKYGCIFTIKSIESGGFVCYFWHDRGISRSGNLF